MNSKTTIGPCACIGRFSLWGVLLATGLLVDEHLTAASSVIASQAPTTPLTTDWQQAQPSEMDVFIPFGEAPAATVPQIFRYDSVVLRPHADYRFTYGNGVQSGPSNQQSTAIHELSPGVRASLGSHWAVDYTPTIRFYSNSKFNDTVDHSFELTGGSQFEAWAFGFSHSSQLTSAPLAETGTQTDQATHTTALTAARALGSKMSVDFAANQQINLVSGFQDSYDWSTLDWLNYQFWPRLNVGLGAGGGYEAIDDNTQTRSTNNLDQTYEQLQARVNWRATDKISFQISGGLEDRQFMTSGTSDSLNPIFGATIQYQPFQVTQLSLSANRTVSSSDYYAQAQQTEITSLSVNLNQRLLKKFSLGLGFAYSTTAYNTSVNVGSTSRTDDNVSFNARLSHPCFQRGTWSVFYQNNDNRSSQPGLSFQSNQVGFEISYSY